MFRGVLVRAVLPLRGLSPQLMLMFPMAVPGLTPRTLEGHSNTELFNHLLLILTLNALINMTKVINHDPMNLKQDRMINPQKAFNHHRMNIQLDVRDGICERRLSRRRTSLPITPSTHIARRAMHQR